MWDKTLSVHLLLTPQECSNLLVQGLLGEENIDEQCTQKEGTCLVLVGDKGREPHTLPQWNYGSNLMIYYLTHKCVKVSYLKVF